MNTTASRPPPIPAPRGPAHSTGLERAAEVGQGKKLGVQKQLDGGQPGQGATPSASPGAAPGSLATPSSPPSTPPGQAKLEKGEPTTQGQGNRPEWAGPHATRGLERALEVGQGKKLGILKHLDGDGPPGPPATTPPPDRGHTSPAIEGPPPHEFQLFFYHGDHLGSSNVITDAFAGVFEHVEYFPFGEPWVDEGGTATLLPYKFTGKELDPETGLYYYGARYYEPRLQRWLSPDALESVLRVGVPPAHNPYQYTLWNPLRFVDPTGLEEEESQKLGFFERILQAYQSLREAIAGKAGQAVESAVAPEGGFPARRREAEELAAALNLPPEEAEKLLHQGMGREVTKVLREATEAGTREVVDLAAITIVTKGAGGAAGGGFRSIETIGRAGRGKGVREVVGKTEDAVSLFKQLTEGATVKPHPKIPGGLIADLPGGGRIGFRPISTSGPPTVDVHNVPGLLARIKIKFIPE